MPTGFDEATKSNSLEEFCTCVDKGAHMLQVLNGGRLRPNECVGLGRIEVELDLAGEQHVAWRAFVLTFEDCRTTIEEIDAVADLKSDERAPTLQDAIEAQTCRLAVRLRAARRLETAAASLYGALSPLQRTRADRLLTVLFRELCSVPDRLSDRHCRRA